MLLPRCVVLAAFAAPLLALPAHGQRPDGRATLLAQARVVAPALSAVAFLSADDASATAGEQGERATLHIVLDGVAGASLGVAVRDGRGTIIVWRLALEREPRRVIVPAPVPSRQPPSDDEARTFTVELVHLGL